MSEVRTRLSIIVVSFSSPSILERCLAALVAQAEPVRADVVVVSRPMPDEQLRGRFPGVHWISAPPEATVPRMRSIGIGASRGDVVALLEDDCLVADGWCAALLSAHEGPWAAVGGPIEPGDYHRALDWGVYFCEYGRFMMPFGGDVAVLPGNNISYKRSALDALATKAGDVGFYETFANARLQQSGHTLKAAPVMSVRHINSWSREWLTGLPYHHGRGYAGLRLAGRSATARVAFATRTLALPAVQVGRLAREVLRRRRLIGRFILALPFVVSFTISWSAGEWVGCLFGPGRSLERWR